MSKKSKVALFVTCNSIGIPPSVYPKKGIIERDGHKAIIVQQYPKGQPAWDITWIHGELIAIARQEVQEMGGQLADVNEDVDFVVVYVGGRGLEEAIGLAAHYPKGRLCFVLCDCNLATKRRLISWHCDGAKEILCECGGQSSMGRLVEKFFRTGAV